MYQRGDISRPNFWIIRKLTWKWLHRELGIIEKKCGYKMCSSNSTGRKHCKMIIEKQKIAFIDLLKKQTIDKNKSLHFIFFFFFYCKNSSFFLFLWLFRIQAKILLNFPSTIALNTEFILFKCIWFASITALQKGKLRLVIMVGEVFSICFSYVVKHCFPLAWRHQDGVLQPDQQFMYEQ